MKTILLPTDFSPIANNAAKYAAALASQTRSKLILVHVVAPEPAGAPDGVMISLPPDERLGVYYQQKLRELVQQLELEFGFLFPLETICVPGILPEQLNDITRRQAADLVVMGTHGAQHFIEKLIGSNTASFIKRAVCPVLVVPENATYQGFKTIAYASDFETDEEVYLQQLLAFAQPFSPALYVINIISEQQLGVVPDKPILQNIQKQFPNINLSIAQLREDDVIIGLEEFVRENQVDLLAVSIQKRFFPDSLFHHSVTRQLAQTSKFPILTLPVQPYRQQPLANWDQPAAQSIR